MQNEFLTTKHKPKREYYSHSCGFCLTPLEKRTVRDLGSRAGLNMSRVMRNNLFGGHVYVCNGVNGLYKEFMRVCACVSNLILLIERGIGVMRQNPFYDDSLMQMDDVTEALWNLRDNLAEVRERMYKTMDFAVEMLEEKEKNPRISKQQLMSIYNKYDRAEAAKALEDSKLWKVGPRGGIYTARLGFKLTPSQANFLDEMVTVRDESGNEIRRINKSRLMRSTITNAVVYEIDRDFSRAVVDLLKCTRELGKQYKLYGDAYLVIEEDPLLLGSPTVSQALFSINKKIEKEANAFESVKEDFSGAIDEFLKVMEEYEDGRF